MRKRVFSNPDKVPLYHPDSRSFIANHYVYRAYRVTDNEVRIAMVRHDFSRSKLFYAFGLAQRRILLNVECQRKGECPAAFTPPCILSGYVGTIRISPNRTDISTLSAESLASVFLWNESGKPRRLDVVDARRKSENYKHELGVCLQPVFLHADWPIFIQFFEYWILQGATKFYVYWESMTDEVDKVVKFYSSSVKNIHIELVPWSELPYRPSGKNASSASKDPSSYWYRLEVFLAIFDCMHRARSDVKYVAQSDLDEVFYVKTSPSLLSLLRHVEESTPKMASTSFLSQRVQVKPNWDSAKYPSDVSLGHFSEVGMERRVFERDFYSKNIYRPERVKRLDIHFRRDAEEFVNASGHLERYQHVNLSSTHAVVLHLRRVDSEYRWTGTYTSHEQAAWVSKLQASITSRVASSPSLSQMASDWINEGSRITSLVEKCRRSMYQRKKEMCYSLRPCKHDVLLASNSSWKVAPNVWTVL